jgi:hypothetical protein
MTAFQRVAVETEVEAAAHERGVAAAAATLAPAGSENISTPPFLYGGGGGGGGDRGGGGRQVLGQLAAEVCSRVELHSSPPVLE